MAIKHIPDGQDFQASDFPKEFGFSGSTGPDTMMTRGPKSVAEPMETGGGDYAGGGHVMRRKARGGEVMGERAMGMHIHPHGHEIMRVEHEPDGRVVHHHAHGGHTVHHPNGHVTHHLHDGQPARMSGAATLEGMHDTSEYAHRNRMSDGDADDQPSFAHGGFAGARPRIPRAMKPHMARRMSPIGEEPVNTPPRQPERMPSLRNTLPGGQMGYGVEPSAESDPAGSEQDSGSMGAPQFARGGKTRR